MELTEFYSNSSLLKKNKSLNKVINSLFKLREFYFCIRIIINIAKSAYLIS